MALSSNDYIFLIKKQNDLLEEQNNLLRTQNITLKDQYAMLEEQNRLLKRFAEDTIGWLTQIDNDLRKK